MNNLYYLFLLASRAIKRHLVILGLVLFLGSQASAQMSHDGTMPKGSEPGAPAGSYSLSGFENVNLYSGNLNFSLPLLKIGGRGGAQSSINLTIDSARWNVNFDTTSEASTTFNWSTPQHIYTDFSTQTHCSGEGSEQCSTYTSSNVLLLGQTITSESPGYSFTSVMVDDHVYGRRPGYGPGVLFSVSISRGALFSSMVTTLTRLTFIAPDGTHYELRDEYWSGVPKIHPRNAPVSRGQVFLSAEGDAISFVSDAEITDYVDPDAPLGEPTVAYPSGKLYFPDGTIYRIINGNVESITDRNGNQIHYWYDASNRVYRIVDSLNRQVDLTYDNPANNPNDPNEQYDDISYLSDDLTRRHIRVYRTKLEQALREDFRTEGTLTPGEMFSELGLGAPGADYNPAGITTRVVLPDTRSYNLNYSQYNEVARVELPTGGAIEYDFALRNSTESHIFRPIKERRVYENGGSKHDSSAYSLKQTYGHSPRVDTTQPYCAEANRCIDATVQEYFHDGSVTGRLVNKEVHSYFGVPYRFDHNFYAFWREGREYQSEVYEPNNPTPLRRVIQEWEQQPVSWALTRPQGSPSNNPRIISTTTELLDTGTTSKLIAKQVYGYDDSNPIIKSLNNRTDMWEYGYGTNAPGTLLRHTQTTYLVTGSAIPTPSPSPSPNPSPTPVECIHCCRDNCRTTSGSGGPTAQEYLTRHLLRLPAIVKVFGVVSNQEQLQSRTEYVYDEYEETTLMARSNITGWTDPGSMARGNVTTTKRWITPANDNAFVKILAKYDVAGNVVETTDPNNAISSSPKVITISYTDCFGSADGNARTGAQPTGLTDSTYAFPTSISNTLGYVAYTKYSYYTGSPVTTEDANGVKTNMFYNEPLGRLTQVISAAGTVLQRQTTFNYDDDADHTITTKSDLNAFNDNKLKSETIYDGLGRTTQARSYESSSSFIKTDMFYDGLGRAVKATNPYRTTSDPTYGTVESKYDALGRVTEVKTMSDGAKVTTAYAGNIVTVTDQAGKQRQSVTDALGRLIDVYEAPEDTTYANYRTSYSYDALNNLQTVTQGQQTRTFTYNGLSQLKSATYPEIGAVANGTYSYGTVSYDEYDANGNLKKKTDARGIVTNYYYDEMNRQTKRTYSGSTPEVNYFYDAQTLPAGAPALAHGASLGQILAVTYGGAGSNNGTYYGYDALGRATKSVQVTGGQTFPTMEYGYNLSGSMTWQKYPSGREVTTQLDDIGRLSSVSGLKGEETKTYASLPEYGAHGGLTALKLGNGLWERTQFNARLQPVEIKLGTESNQASILKLNYSYGTTDNNGNVRSQTITVPGMSQLTQSYTYDALNRLLVANETGGTNPWQQYFKYDRYGNRNFIAEGTNVPYPLNNINNPTVNPANNRLEGHLYDLAGNVTRDAQNRSFSYDAENHQIAYNGGAVITNNDSASYGYDGDGRRVKKQVGGSMISTVFVYNISGQMVAEYTDSTEARTTHTSYLTTDTLGTARVVTGQGQQVKERHDYLPFGEEIGAQWGRTGDQKFGVNATRQQFTGYENDNETGLDYAQARYYDRMHGRFTSPDPLLDSARAELPQSWNRYIYCLNNPLVYVDPTGLDPWLKDSKGAYHSVTQEQYDKMVNERDSEGNLKYTPVPAGTRIGLLQPGSVGGPSDFISRNRPLEGYEVKLGEDGNFELVDPGLFHSVGQEIANRSAPVQTVMKGIAIVDTIIIAGPIIALEATGGSVTLGLEAATESAAESVTATTVHGAEQIAARVVTEADMALTRTGTQLLQRDGARVFLKEVVPGKFNVLVEGQRGVVTAMKNISWRSVCRLGANYGYYSPL